MAAAALKRYAWAGAAVFAAAVIVALALHGRRPEPGLVRFEVAGVMLHIAPERVREVQVAAGGRRWTFTRVAAGDWTVAGPAVASGDWTSRIESGLRFLHVSTPQSVMTRDEYAGTPAAEFGLDPPRYLVSVRAPGAEPFTVQFGSANPQGLAQYVRVAGRDELFLLPRFVGEPWEAMTGLR